MNKRFIIMEIFQLGIIPFVMTLIAIHFLSPLAVRLKLVDHPGGRKKHHQKTPLIGGIAMLFGFSFSCLFLPVSLQVYRGLFAAMIVIVSAGILDDFQEITPMMKLFCQLLAAFLICIFGKQYFSRLGNLFYFSGNIHLGVFAIPLTVLAIVGLINAVNMIDGVDGLAGTLAFIQLSLITFLSIQGGVFSDYFMLFVLLSVLLAFLCFNFPYAKDRHAKIFLGDAGSMMLGIILSWFIIKLSQDTTPHVMPVTFLWIMALPLFDLFNVMIHRVSNGRSPFSADREHLHHILKDAGFGNLRIVTVMSFLTLLFGGIGILGAYLHVPDSIMLVLFITLFCLYLYAIHHARQLVKRIILVTNHY